MGETIGEALSGRSGLDFKCAKFEMYIGPPNGDAKTMFTCTFCLYKFGCQGKL